MQPGARRASAKQVEPAAPPASASRRSAAARPSRRSQAAEVLEPTDRNVEYSSGTSRVRPTRSSAEQREQVDDRRGRYSTRGTAQNEEKSKATLIAIVAGGLVVIGLVALLAGTMGGGKGKARVKSDGLRTPQEYVKLADEQLRLGNKPAAIDYLHKASEGWSEIGQDEEARRCNVRAYSIGKGATFSELDR
jgi:hypothetical protein